MKSEELLSMFTAFCRAHPELGFWQALRAWSCWPFIYVSRVRVDDIDTLDTFDWEDDYRTWPQA